MVLPLRVSSADSNFSSVELAHTLDISTHGARLGAIRRHIPIGTELVLRYRQRRIPSRVVWAKRLEGTGEQQIGVEILTEAGRDAWGINLTTVTVNNDPEPEVVCV